MNNGFWFAEIEAAFEPFVEIGVAESVVFGYVGGREL